MAMSDEQRNAAFKYRRDVVGFHRWPGSSDEAEARRAGFERAFYEREECGSTEPQSFRDATHMFEWSSEGGDIGEYRSPKRSRLALVAAYEYGCCYCLDWSILIDQLAVIAAEQAESGKIGLAMLAREAEADQFAAQARMHADNALHADAAARAAEDKASEAELAAQPRFVAVLGRKIVPPEASELRAIAAQMRNQAAAERARALVERAGARYSREGHHLRRGDGHTRDF